MLTTADLFHALRRLRLVEPAKLDQAERQLREASHTAGDGIQALVRQQLLTAYQGELLGQGRGEELVMGSYVLLDRLGQGGMGAVYKARQWKLGRIVALKLIRPERLVDEDAVRRFRREMRASAQLDHLNIIRAYDADELNGVHFFTMEYVEGVDLAQTVKTHGPLPVRLACEYIRQAACGLTHAHERGMVHRDIKPSNLLVQTSRPGSRQPEPIVKILDLGLARFENHTDSATVTSLTASGMVMGTPDFLAPEQTRDARSVDIRADLYSLGCTLYYLLTGRVPFPGGSLGEKLVKHQLDEPAALESFRRDVPPPLAAVVRKLMAKNPDDRYQSPAELAAALADPGLLESRAMPEADAAAAAPAALLPVPESAAESVTESSTEVVAFRRRRAAREATQRNLIIGLSVALPALIGMAAVAWLMNKSEPPPPVHAEPQARAAPQRHASTKPTRPSPAQQEAEARKRHAEEQKRRESEAAKALETLAAKTADPKATFGELAREVNRFKGKYGGTVAAVKAAEMLEKLPSPLDQLDPKKLPQDCLDNWQISGEHPPRELVGVLGEHRWRLWGPAVPIAIRRDEQELACGGEGDITLIDPATGTARTQFKAHSGYISTLAYSPSGDILVSASKDLTFKMWDMTQRPPKCVHVFDGYPNWCYGVAFHPQGRLLGLASCDGTVQFWDIRATPPAKAHEFKLARAIFYATFSPDGKYFAIGGTTGVSLWDLSSGAPVAKMMLRCQGIAAMAVFGPNSKWLAVADDQNGIQIWDLDGPEPKARERLLGHENRIEQLAISPDGACIASLGQDITIRLWNLTTKKATILDRQWGGFCFSDSGKRLFTAASAVRCWDVASATEVQPLTGHTGYLWSVELSPDGKMLASASSDHTARLWDLAAGHEVHTLSGAATGNVRCVAFSPDGKLLVSASDDAAGTIKLWDPATGGELRTLTEHADSVVSVAFSPDGKTLASASHDRTAKLWDLATGKEIHTLLGHTNHVYSVAFSPDGSKLATGGNDGTVRIWDVGTGTELKTLGGHSSLSVAFSPDGKMLASGNYDGSNSAAVWDVATGRAIHTLQGHGSYVRSVAFSPDGQTLASASMDGTVRLWDPVTGLGKQVFRPIPQIAPIYQVAFAADGRHLAAANANGTVYILRLTESAPRGSNAEEAKKP